MSDSTTTTRADLETSLDFVNTFGLTHGQHFDDFPTTREAINWLRQRIGLDPELVADSPAELARITRARSAFRELWDATAEDRPVAEGAVREVNRVLRHRSVLELEAQPADRAGAGLRLASRFTGDEVDCALAELAEPLVRAIGGEESAKARICANDTCRWVFFDNSRTHQRRWCDMASCGNRAKAARHRARARASQPATDPPTDQARD
ncbi:MAG TPA: CGNR zinc finger domain-containing protein [Candidatus Limnocylindrales bacterium]|nr:CGNR zinc finger domain-containing protein [Candidatus Limnocylindrales bacterium]